MPKLARQMMLQLINFSQEAVFQLETEPTNTIEFVKALNSLDEINKKVHIWTISDYWYIYNTCRVNH